MQQKAGSMLSTHFYQVQQIPGFAESEMEQKVGRKKLNALSLVHSEPQ
jgi:hypothetical protein